jgi:hypothetical protein
MVVSCYTIMVIVLTDSTASLSTRNSSLSCNSLKFFYNGKAMLSRKLPPGIKSSKTASSISFFRLDSVPRLACVSLIFILLVGSLGSFALPNYMVYAQDSDGDGYEDVDDQCPNDPTAWSWVSPCPLTGGQTEIGGATGEEVSTPENTVTEGGVSQPDICDNTIDDDNDGAADSLDPEGCITDGGTATEEEALSGEKVTETIEPPPPPPNL